MRRFVALICLVASCSSCGGDVVQEVREELPSVAETPAGPEILPPGWYLHLYPGLCVIVVRDENGVAQRCYVVEDRTKCVPTNLSGCRGFP
ncbi:MAG: hypothetical protein ACOZQL_10810 [Myxococcota bacterium]